MTIPLNITFSTINVNSMNVSTLGSRNSKTFVKIEGVTGKKADVIFLCDIRVKDKGDDIKRLFGLTRNGCYKLYLNSTREIRGVGIAIKWSIAQDVRNVIIDNVTENYILLDLIIKGTRVTLGSIYGPNGNKPEFFAGIRRQIEQIGNPFVIGGDFNTVLCQDVGVGNVDRKGEGRIPNFRNSKVINDWIDSGGAIEPL
jgi:exonuclease III